MEIEKKLWKGFRRAVGWVTTALDWWACLTALHQLLAAAIAAIPVGGLTLSFPLALPTTPLEWIRFSTASLFIGLGMFSLGRLLLQAVRQLFAERKFRRLPRSYKEHLAAMAESEGLWRTSRTKAIYVDLSNKGLIRDDRSVQAIKRW